jgi:hypothetical protein
LAAVASHIRYGHSTDAQFSENFLDRFEPGRLNNRFELCHHILALRMLRGFESLLRHGSDIHYRAILPGNSTL